MKDNTTRITNVPPEQQAIRDKCRHPTGTFVELTKEAVEKSIPERFEQIVRRCPGQVAVKMGERSLTYDELNRQANRIAHAILRNRAHDAQSVALFIEDRISMTAAILGALKAGKIAVPLDPTYPAERNAFMIRDCGASLVVCDQSGATSLTDGNAAAHCQTIELEKLALEMSSENPRLPISSDRYAHIMYTSGSTGKPKGVISNHEMILNELVWSTNTLGICQQDRLTLFHSLSFSGATYNFYGALLNGATLLPFDLKQESYLDLVRWLQDENVTILHAVPAVFRLLVEHLTGREKYTALRVVVLGGDVVSKSDLERFRKHFPPTCALLHRMGTTETNTVCSYFVDHTIVISGNEVPLGWPPEGKELSILNEAGHALGLEQVGEIAVKGRYLAPGYWNDPVLTRAKFLEAPEAGTGRVYLTGDLGRMTQEFGLIHLGRKDSQARVRGHRIETAEIEVALAQHPQVKEALVIVTGSQDGESRLIAYVTVHRKTPPGASELRHFLQVSLPSYMLPSRFIILDSMPLLPNGKVDRRALPDPGHTRPKCNHMYVAPRSNMEAELAGIWANVLCVDQIGIYDNFFDLGGQSLLASRIVSRVIQAFQLELAVNALFDSPTIAEMAAVIAKHHAKRADESKLIGILQEVESMSDEEARDAFKNLKGAMN